MVAEIKHARVLGGTNDPAKPDLIGPEDWDDVHDVTGLALAAHTHAGADIDSGMVADARIASTIARDSETATAVASEATARDAAIAAEASARNVAIAAEATARDAAIAAYAQPLDSDLQAIAALSTTAYGRAFLVLANAAAGRTALGLGTAAVAATGDFDAAGAAAAAQAASQPVDSDLTAIGALSTTAYGRSLLTAADAAALRTLAGAEAAANKGVAGGYASLDGGGTVPDAQLPAALARDSEVTTAVAAEASARDTAIAAAIAALVNSAPGVLDTLEEIADALGDDPSFAATMTTALAGKQALDAELSALAGLVSAADRLPYFTGIGSASLATFTSFARTLVDDADAAAARTTLGLGTAALAATGDFDAAGAAAAAQAASQPLDSDLTAFAALAIAADKLPYGTGSHALGLADFTAAGRALVDDADAAAQRTTLGVPPSSRSVSAGTGLTGGGDLSADRTLAADIGASGDMTAEAIGSTVSAGASGKVSDAAHRHAMPAAGGTGDIVASAVGDTVAAGASGKIADAAHRHAREAFGTVTAAIGTAAGGSATTPSKSDHVHAASGDAPSTQAFGDAAAAGSSAKAAQSDHKHAMPANPATFVGCRLTNSTTQAIPTGTGPVLTFDTEDYDTDGFHSGSGSRCTIPAGKDGKYVINAGTYFASSGVGTYRIVAITKNGAAVAPHMRRGVTPGDPAIALTVGPLDLVATDYIEVIAYQDSGGNLNVGSAATTEFRSTLSLWKVG